MSYTEDANARNLTELNNSEQTGNLDRSQQISALSQVVIRDLCAMMQGMFDGIDDSFFELANHAHSNNEQNRFFEAMRDIRIKRKGIEKQFKHDLDNSFLADSVTHPKQSSAPLTQNNLEPLSLVQNDTLEEEVAISSMASKAAANLQGPLLQFNTRIANLYQAKDPAAINAPIDPKALSQSFANACDILEIEIKEKLIVLKQFDRYVLSNLGLVLTEANKLLISFGIIPQFKNQARVSQSLSKTRSTPNTQGHASPEISTTERQVESGQQNVLAQLHNLLANVRSNNPQALPYASNRASIPENSETKFVSTQDLINLLSAIQEHEDIKPLDGANPESAKVVNIQNALKQRLSHGGDQVVYPTFKQTDEDNINLVAMLFEFILDDYNLSPTVQVLISRLQIPILKVVINDNSFFSSPKHPARKLLNLLAKSGVSCSESNSSKDHLLAKIEQTVQTIIDQFDGDITLFHKLYKDFTDFISKEEKKSKIVEQRTKESEIGQIKSRLAQQAVEQTLDRILSNSTVMIPDVISETLQGGWSRVMFLSKLKDEHEHQWIQTCKIAEELVWCLQPFSNQKDKQRWVAIAPKLLKNLKSGLEEVSYNAAGLEQSLLDVRTTLTNAFKYNSLLLESPDHESITLTTPASDISDKSAIERQQQTQTSRYEEYADELTKLSPGTWVELNINGKKFRWKLSIVVDESQSYIFVNRMGLQAKELSRLELLKLFSDNAVVVLTQAPIIDRALNSLTKSLQQKASA